MERALGLMCGAGILPARMAHEARRQGWRVIAFTFADAPGIEAQADRVVASRIVELQPVLATLLECQVPAVLFSGTFRLDNVLRLDGGDTVSQGMAGGAGSLGERRLAHTVVATLAGLGIEVLDQRAFVGDWIGMAGCWTRRQPTDREWEDVRSGLVVARRCAQDRIGQTAVVKRGVVAAVEALEGTTAAVRRGASLAGPGAVVVKAVADDNDYRFDTPTIGPETVEVASAGGVSVVAVDAGRVLVVDRSAAVTLADERGVALVGVDGGDTLR